MPRTAPPLFVVVLTLAGCVKFEDGETAAGTETTTAATATTATTAGMTAGTTAPDEPTTGSAGGECSLWEQDCNAGMKCVPYDSMHTGVVDATRCVEVADPPRAAGDPCATEGGVVGLDDCDVGLLCWQLDGEGQGTCIPLCVGAPADPQCDDGLVCDVSNGGLLPLCLTRCSPLTKDCPDGQICISAGPEGFVCDGDASGEEGQYGDPCEFINVCDPGLLCLDSTNVPGCNTPGCCTPYCDLTMPECPGAADGQECLPYFPNDSAPPGLENVGVCGMKD